MVARFGLKGKLAVVLGVIILVAFGLIYLATSSLATTMLARQETRSLLAETDIMVSILVGLAHDPGELEAALNVATSRGGLVTIQILNNELETMTPGNCTPAQVMLGSQRLGALLGAPDGVMRTRSPAAGELFAALRPLPGGGYLFAARSTAGFLQRRQSIVTLLVIWGAVVMLAILLGGSIVLRNVVARPIDRLVREAGAIATGSKSLPAAGLESDEFGLLQQSLTSMAGRLQEDRRKIEDQVAELTAVNRRLREAHEQLIRTEKLASVGQLAAGVAHEIGNPIGVILGYAEMLEEPELDDETHADSVRQIKVATERIQGTIRELLDFSRPAADEERDSDFVAESRSIVQFVSPQKRFCNVAMELHAPETPVARAAIPPSRFKQVLLNLLFNASDAMDHKGRIDITVAATPNHVQLTVADNGPGIDSETMLRIFDPFFTTKEVGTGTGLGLFVCHTIVNRYNGSIEVSSPPGEGARFTLAMPRIEG